MTTTELVHLWNTPNRTGCGTNRATIKNSIESDFQTEIKVFDNEDDAWNYVSTMNRFVETTNTKYNLCNKCHVEINFG